MDRFHDGGAECVSDRTKWFRNEAESGDPLAQFIQANVALAHRNPGGVYRNSDAQRRQAEYREWLEKSAATGFSRAQNDLALLLLAEADKLDASNDEQSKVHVQHDGTTVQQSSSSADLRSRAAQLYELAAELEADAMYNVARVALEEAVAQSKAQPGTAATHFRRAVQLFQTAANMGSSLAMFNLGVANYNGVGTAAGQNLTAALKWFLCSETAEGMRYAAAAIRHPNNGDNANLTAAQHWTERAALMGDSSAQWQLVQTLHDEGNDGEAMKWLKVAASYNNDPQAMYALGRLILQRAGPGLAAAEQAEREAMEYLTTSAALGWQEATSFLASRRKEDSLVYQAVQAAVQ